VGSDQKQEANTLMVRQVFPRRDVPGYEQFLQALQQSVQQELVRLWAERPLASPGHRLEENHAH
jgi:hypothetical protein